MSPINIQGARIIDLSQTLEPGVPVPPGFPAPQLDIFLSQQKGNVANVEILTTSLHAGTHMDAPYHFFSKLRTVDELPADALVGPAVVVDLFHKKGCVPLEAVDFMEWESKSGQAIQAGDIVLLHTGHDKNWKLGTEAERYWINGWPYLTRSAAEYLAEKPIRALGVECFDPDWVDLKNLASAEFPTHRTFLPKGILIIENLTNLDKIGSTRCQVIALPLKLKGCSGSPVRVIAVVP